MLQSFVSINVNWQYSPYKGFTAYWERYYFTHNVASFYVDLFIVFVECVSNVYWALLYAVQKYFNFHKL